MGIFLRRSIIGIMSLGSYPENSIVKINEDSSPVEFYIAKHDYESELNGVGGTLLFRMDACSETMNFGNTNSSAYEIGPLDAWNNETYFQRLDPSLREKILLTKFYYTARGGLKEVTTLERKIFQLSGTEYGLSATALNVEGTEIPVAAEHVIAYLDGAATSHWTRSPNNTNSSRAYYVNASGAATGNVTAYSAKSHPRPAFVLPSNTIVGDDMLIT